MNFGYVTVNGVNSNVVSNDNYSIIKNMLQIDMEYDNFISYQKV